MFVIIAPTCWFGSPHDFWWLAPTALTATATACVAIMVRFEHTPWAMAIVWFAN